MENIDYIVQAEGSGARGSSKPHHYDLPDDQDLPDGRTARGSSKPRHRDLPDGTRRHGS